MAIDETQASSLLNYLPAIFQDGSAPGQPNFMGRFLLAFERILLGLGEGSEEIPEPGLEEAIAGVQRYFEPERTPTEFLRWLASWVALTLRDDWDEAEKRRFVSRIVPLYQQRGTKAGLVEMLRIYTSWSGRGGIEIYEFIQPLQVGVTSKVGVDTMVGGGPPHYFLVQMNLIEPDPVALSRTEQIARSIIDQEKPAHTYYDLRIEFPTMQVGVTSRVGVDTLLGTPPS